ncbi:MAG: tRNA dihydrouridine synthase DusB [Clostridia bacterium]|nr:tRNA dihydrouridine synthase DusB [Clostridia bacterium]
MTARFCEKSRELFSILKKGGEGQKPRPPVLLAPMAGITDSVFRRMCIREGCDFTFTEMVSASGLHFNNKKTRDLISIDPAETPCGIQLFGHDPALMADTVKRLFETLVSPDEISSVDINMGCPAPKITSNCDGSSLMRDPLLAGRIVEAAVKASPVPISVKFRKGWDDASVNAVEFARVMEQSGAAFLSVHGRTRMQMYSGAADRELIAEVVAAVSVPVVGNGDIFSADSAVDMLEKTGCAGLMIARGAQGNPFVFREIAARLDGKTPFVPTESERLGAALAHITEYCRDHGGGSFVDMRKHIAWYTKGMYGSTELRRQVNSCRDENELVSLVRAFMDAREVL